eukprot:scaffold3161_cov247-Ochromonas_danica.AAC.15
MKWSPVNLADMFIDAFKRPGETWKVCHVALGDSLPDDILDSKGIVITGSRFNCRDRETLPWFDPLCEIIRQVSESGQPKIYGGCFGCQIIAHALGGEVDYNPTKRFALKAENVRFLEFDDNTVSTLPTMSTDLTTRCKTKGLKLLVSHGDCVAHLPPHAKLLARSDSCASEVYLTGSAYNILACQSHPEFDLHYAIEERIWKSVVETSKRLDEEEIKQSLASFQEYDGKDAVAFLDWISEFLHA